MSETTKQAIDIASTGIGAWGMANIIGIINLYLPPILLISAILWAIMRWSEKVSGKNFHQFNWVNKIKNIFRKK